MCTFDVVILVPRPLWMAGSIGCRALFAFCMRDRLIALLACILFSEMTDRRQCRTTLDCVPAQVCNKETHRCERNITLYTLDSADWSEDYSSSATIRTGDAVTTAGYMTFEVGTSGAGDGSDLTLLAGSTSETTANGGDVVVKAGDVEASARASLPTGSGGDVSITSGASVVGGFSGKVAISSAASSATGDVLVETGDASKGNSGDVMLLTGDAVKGAGGNISIIVGSGDAALGGQVTIAAGESTAAAGIGGDVIVSGGAGVQTGGSVAISGGNSDTDGGDLDIISGQGPETSGTIDLTTGDSKSTGAIGIVTGTANGGPSGGITLKTGAATGGAAGDIDISVSPSDESNGGEVTIVAGTSTVNGGAGGDVTIAGGNSLAGTGGSVTLSGGDAGAIVTSKFGGEVAINGGGGTDTDGIVSIGTQSTSKVSVGASDVDVAVAGKVTLDGSLRFPGTTGALIFGIYKGESQETTIAASATETIEVPVVGITEGDVATCSVTPSTAKVGFEYIQIGDAKVTVSAKNYDAAASADVTVICLVQDVTGP